MSCTVESMQEDAAAILLQGLRRLEQLGISEPVVGESLSSWGHRINMQIETPISSYQFFVSDARRIDQGDAPVSSGSICAEPDDVAANDWVNNLVQTLDIPRQWFESQFPFFDRPYTPLRYRRAFCYECLAQSVQAVGLPVWKSEWRHLTQPLCSLHSVPLLDAPVSLALTHNHPVRAFAWYWDSLHAIDHFNLICSAWTLRNAFALNVQRRFDDLRARASDRAEQSQIDGFMLSLMRAVLMPCLHHAYPKFIFSDWGGTDAYSRDAFYIQFYQEVFRAPGYARVGALYLCGVVLGWITEEEARSTSSEGYFTPARAWHIWEVMGKNSSLLTLLGAELRCYESKSLNISSLADIPACWRDK